MDLKKISLFFGLVLCDFVIWITSIISMSLMKGDALLIKEGSKSLADLKAVSITWVGLVPFIFSTLVLVVLAYYAYLNYDKKD